LGFTLPKIETACIKVERNYRDLINKTVITHKSRFIECLSHDSFVVQTGRITDRYQTRLDKLLSVFEQAYFTDDTRVVKQYKHEPDEEDVKLITDILHYNGTEPEERKLIEIEQEAWRTYNDSFAERRRELDEKIEERDKKIEEKDKEIEEQDKALKENYKALGEKDKALEEKDRALEENYKEIEDLKRRLNLK
jgi:DNA repair exonuclease SbcCD ATPase subunit